MQLATGTTKRLYFKDSCLLLNMPLKLFNKNLGLGLNMEKEIQEYDFMSKNILASYLNEGRYLTI